MAYNYAAAYGTSYGQYAAQPSYTTQQTSASGYGQYGQTASAYGTASSATTTSTTASSITAHGYGTTGSTTTTAQNTYNFPYNYNYGDSSMYNAAAAATSALQAFHQSWYSNTSSAQTATGNQQTSTTAQTTTPQQQQQYGQYLQQYQQQMSAYQQYANNVVAKTNTQQQQQQQTPSWGNYSQSQQQQQRQPQAANTNRTDGSKTGWGAYQPAAMGSQQSGASSQQKTTGVVYRTPMKYTADTTQYGSSNVGQSYGSNQTFKSPITNTAQPYSGGQTNYNSQGYNAAGNQGFGGNQYGNSQQPQQPQQQQSQHQFGGNMQMKNQSGYQGYQQSGQNMSGYNNQAFGNMGRGGFSGHNNAGNMGGNVQGPQRGGMGPMMPQRSPMGRGGPGYGNNMGPPRDRPDIPPFPRAWHSQDDFQRGGGFNEQKERWGPSGRGGFNQQQGRGMYNNNSRNARGSNRELWSPAQKSNAKPDKEIKTTPVKKEENTEKIDKDKHPEIKSYLYAWLGAKHLRPTYDIRQIGERPNIMFRCDLRVDNYNFVGVGKASSKKEAQTTAAWKFAEYLIKIGEVTEAELPSRQVSEDVVEGEIGDVREDDGESPNKGRREMMDNRNRDRRGPNRGRMNRRGNQNWPPPQEMMQGEIPPLMAVPVGPWGAPPPPMGPPPPRMMGPPPPGMMDYGPPFWDEGWGMPPMGMGPPPMGPPMHMRPPPPFMRRNQNDFWRRRDIEERMMDLSRGAEWAHPEDMFISQMIRNQQEGERRQRGQRQMPPMEAPPGEWERVQQPRPVVTSDDRHVMAKHAEVYPQEGELKGLHRIVNTVEQALKLLSDKFVDEDHPREDAKKEEPEKADQSSDKKEETKSEEEQKKESSDSTSAGESKDAKEKSEGEKQEKEEKKDEKRAKIKILKRPKRAPRQVDTRPRVLCGVNRIGPLAKGLLITKDDHVELALLCGEIPTIKLLDRIMDHIEEKLCDVDEDFKLMVEKREEEAGFLIKSLDEASPVEVMVILTAMALRRSPEKKSDKKKEDTAEKSEPDNENKEDIEEKKEDNTAEEPDPEGMLPKRKMLDALACLRHTHWFQAKACGVQSCIVLTRILRDLQRRDELWSNLSDWALEVLIFNCLSSSEEQMSPGDACRRFFEVVAGGILLPDMPGIVDPCEKAHQRDVLDCLTAQDREALTRSAQRYLRQLAFREIHVILGIDKLSPSYKGDGHPPHNKPKEQKTDEKEKQAESNNQRKRRFEHNGNDSVAESPKRSLTDEEDTDTQQNLAELSISDENSEGRSALDDADADAKDKDDLKDGDNDMETGDSIPRLSQEEEDALLEGDDDEEEKMEE